MDYNSVIYDIHGDWRVLQVIYGDLMAMMRPDPVYGAYIDGTALAGLFGLDSYSGQLTNVTFERKGAVCTLSFTLNNSWSPENIVGLLASRYACTLVADSESEAFESGHTFRDRRRSVSHSGYPADLRGYVRQRVLDAVKVLSDPANPGSCSVYGTLSGLHRNGDRLDGFEVDPDGKVFVCCTDTDRNADFQYDLELVPEDTLRDIIPSLDRAVFSARCCEGTGPVGELCYNYLYNSFTECSDALVRRTGIDPLGGESGYRFVRLVAEDRECSRFYRDSVMLMELSRSMDPGTPWNERFRLEVPEFVNFGGDLSRLVSLMECALSEENVMKVEQQYVADLFYDLDAVLGESDSMDLSGMRILNPFVTGIRRDESEEILVRLRGHEGYVALPDIRPVDREMVRRCASGLAELSEGERNVERNSYSIKR